MNRTLLLVVTAILGSAIYLISLHAPFIYDDVDQILFNPKLHSLSPLINVIFCDFRQIRVFSNLSYALDWWLSSGLTWSFHLTNILIHLINTVLAWCFLDRILSNGGKNENNDRLFLRDFTSLLFLIHPIQAEAVSYIGGRTTLLQGTGILTTLLVFSSERRKPYLVAILIILSLALKESCLLVPFLLLGYEFTVNKRTWKTVAWKEFGLYFGCLFFMLPLYIILKDPHSMYDGTTGFSLYPFGSYLIWQFRYYLFYFWIFLNSGAQSVIHAPPDPSIEVFIGGLLGTGCYFGSVWFVWRNRLKYPIASFFIILFLLPLLPTNSFFQMINPFAEYRLYLSNLSACFLFSWILLKTVQLMKTNSLQRTVVYSIVVFFFVTSIVQQLTWSNDIQLFSKTVENYPNYYKTHLLLGGAYEEKGDLELAKEQYIEAMNLVQTMERIKTYRPSILLARIELKQENYRDCIATLDSIKINLIHGAKPPLVYYQTYLFALSKVNDRKKFEELNEKALQDYPNAILPRL